MDEDDDFVLESRRRTRLSTKSKAASAPARKPKPVDDDSKIKVEQKKLARRAPKRALQPLVVEQSKVEEERVEVDVEEEIQFIGEFTTKGDVVENSTRRTIKIKTTTKTITVQSPSKIDRPDGRTEWLLKFIHENQNPCSAETAQKLDNAIESKFIASEFPVENLPGSTRIVMRALTRLLPLKNPDGSLRFGSMYWRGLSSELFEFIQLDSSPMITLVRMVMRRRHELKSEQGSSYAALVLRPADNIYENDMKNLVERGLLQNATEIDDLDFLLDKASAPTLISVAKEFKLTTVNVAKSALADNLLSHCKKQKPLFANFSLENTLLRKLRKAMQGNVYTIRWSLISLIECIMTLGFPAETRIIEDATGSHFQQAVSNIVDRIQTPAPEDPPIIDIFGNIEDLLILCNLKYTEFKQYVKATNWRAIVDVYEKCVKPLKSNLNCSFEELPDSCRLLAPQSVFTRCAFQAVSALEREKEYVQAVDLLKELVLGDTALSTLFWQSEKFHLYERLVINLQSHLRKPEEAGDVLRIALKDPVLREKDILLLQDRAVKLLTSNFKPIVIINDPIEVHIKAPAKVVQTAELQRRVFTGIAEDGNVEVIGVEEAALRHYKEHEGFTMGMHSESKLWHGVYASLYWDIIFDNTVPNAWFSSSQIKPLDLNTFSYYSSRKTKIDERTKWVEECSPEELEKSIADVWCEKAGVSNALIDFENFGLSLEEFMDFIRCVPQKVLAFVCLRMSQDFRGARSGFPDLVVWNPEKKSAMVIEVKGPGDRLSPKQRLWLHYFNEHGQRAVVCYVSADNGRAIKRPR